MKGFSTALVVAMALVLTTAAAVSAQPLAKRFSVSAGIGADFPIWRLTGLGATTGFEGGVGLEWMADRDLGIGASIRYSRFGEKNKMPGVNGSHRSTFLFDMSGRLFLIPGSATRPFLTAGVMAGLPKGNTISERMLFGFRAGGGVQLMISPSTGVFGVFTYNKLGNRDMEWYAVSAGVSIYFGGGR